MNFGVIRARIGTPAGPPLEGLLIYEIDNFWNILAAAKVCDVIKMTERNLSTGWVAGAPVTFDTSEVRFGP